MTKPQINIFDATTGNTIIRDMNEIELAQHETDIAQAKKEVADQVKADQALADKRQIILDRLGLTAEEFAALLG